MGQFGASCLNTVCNPSYSVWFVRNISVAYVYFCVPSKGHRVAATAGESIQQSPRSSDTQHNQDVEANAVTKSHQGA